MRDASFPLKALSVPFFQSSVHLRDDGKLRQQKLGFLLTGLAGSTAVGEVLERNIRRAALGDVRAQLRRLCQAEDACGRHELDTVVFGELFRVCRYWVDVDVGIDVELCLGQAAEKKQK